MKSCGLSLTRKAQASLGGILIIVISVTTIIFFLNQRDELLSLEKQAYLKQYNQQLLLNALNYENGEGVSVKELLSANACGANLSVPVSEVMSKMLKKGYNYVFQTNSSVYYSEQPVALVEEIMPARITLKTYCGKNIGIIMGAYQ